MRYIGDVHGLFSAYESIAEEVDESIQVGDFGVGFGSEPPMIGEGHRFIRGNHDNPEKCATYSAYLGEFGMHGDIFFAGGGYSIDAALGQPYIDWWPNEQLTRAQMKAAGDLFVQKRPDIVVTHMCPASVEERIFDFPYNHPNPTHHFLQSLLIWHVPKLWVFGHYHEARDVKIDDCRYICLGELQYIDIESS